MSYEIAFYALITFIAGRLSVCRIYIGKDRAKYEKAHFGVLLKQ